MKCKCGKKMVGEFVFVGGCQGHDGPEDYCYCSDQDCYITFGCPLYYKNPRKHSQAFIPLELSDKHAIMRFIESHMTDL